MIKLGTDEQVAALTGKHGELTVLQGVSVNGRLDGTLASLEVEQRYLNPNERNIEAVYTFPLPIGAVLLGMEVEIAGRKLAAQVVERQAAERRYEDALTDGDSAVMVQDVGNGLYTMNVGNLMAHESAQIRFRFALPLSWQGDQLRFVLPTTIAPRYGDAGRAGLKPWQVPQSSLHAEYPFEFSLVLEGELAKAEIASPTHPISVAYQEGAMRIHLSRPAGLDRDLVLTAGQLGGYQSLVVTPDHHGQVAFASLRVPQLATQDEALCLKIVIDCSGSMAGVSIVQARKAALAMLDLLRPKDWFNITFFGSQHESLFPNQMLRASHDTVELARHRLQNLQADMGGTELGEALKEAYRLSPESWNWQRAKFTKGLHTAVLLITDGEIWDFQKVVADAKASSHRVFTVGVGMSSAEGFIKKVAIATGAASEFVAPQEGMAERILTQFHRLNQRPVSAPVIHWDVAPLWQTPLPEVVFSGDTLHVFAGFTEQGPKQVRLGTGDIQPARLVDWPDLPRVAAHARIAMTEDADLRLQLALAYQLLTSQTNLLVVAEREIKAGELPELVQVSHMQAAGWSGHGLIQGQCHVLNDMNTIVRSSICQQMQIQPSLSRSAPDYLDIPAFGRKTESIFASEDTLISEIDDPLASGHTVTACTPDCFLENLNRALGSATQVQSLPDTIPALAAYGLPQDIVAALEIAGEPEQDIVLAFLHALMASPLGGELERGLRRLLIFAVKRAAHAQQLSAEMQSGFADLSRTGWGKLADELQRMVLLP